MKPVIAITALLLAACASETPAPETASIEELTAAEADDPLIDELLRDCRKRC